MKCPKCDRELDKQDIEDISFVNSKPGRITVQHFVYVCKKCGYIIGVGVLR